MGCGISDNLVKAAALCLPGLVCLIFGGQDPFQAPCSCSRLSGEDLAEQGSDGFVFSAPGGLRRLILSLSPSPGTGDTSWHCCGGIFVWAGGIFLFLLMVCCGQPRLPSDLTGVCHHSYFSPECFPVFASAAKGETKVTAPSEVNVALL